MIFIFVAGTVNTFAQPVGKTVATNGISILEVQGSVEILPAGTTVWIKAQPGQMLHPLDRVHTAENSRVALRWSDQSIVPFGASTELEILPPGNADEQSGLHLIRGILSFFHRDQPGRIRVITHGAVAGVEGTEFVLAVDAADRTLLAVVDGKGNFGRVRGTLVLTNGQQAVVEMGQPPARTAGFIANNLLQWCFYYPAVIDPEELQLTAEEQKVLAASLEDYRSGDLLAALAHYPTNRENISDPERIFHAALLLSVGEVERTEAMLSVVSEKSERPARLAAALRRLIAAVKRQPAPAVATPQLASEMLADSYFEQSRAVRETSLQNALRLAQAATTNAPKFGFAWARMAELEFSFGNKPEALAALEQSLVLAPRNAQALALKGFILAAQNNPRAAREWFDRAIATDAALGNAWLGRGIARIRLGDKKGGSEDLLVAAALEPQRSELRSYLGKAYTAAGDNEHATKELNLAKKLDPRDPTPWLYSALLNQQENQVNDAIRDLDQSQAMNNNRSVYRSQLMLDEDRAVRSANLASMYRDAGMNDLSVREASRALSYDYANFSSHLFLADSYDELSDPTWNNLRYDTPATAEYNIANLLAPVSAGPLSSITSQQGYAKLFEQNRFGVVSDTTYLSRGAWYEHGAQFGTYDNLSYSFESSYISDPGQQVNDSYEQRFMSLTLKDQFTSQDTAFVDVQQAQINSGDVREYYNPAASANPTLQVDDKQQPNVYLGYHHEWSPGVHTLFFGAYYTGPQYVNAGNSGQYLNLWNYNLNTGVIDPSIPINTTFLIGTPENYTITPNIYSTELQQIWETPEHTTIIGTRYQWGDNHYQLWQGNTYDPIVNSFFPGPNQGVPPYPTIIQQDFTSDFQHLTVYGYHNWQIADAFMLAGGLSYDNLYMPENVSSTPFSHQEKTTTQVSPKAGFIWTPARNTMVHGAYTRSLSGMSEDQSIRIEPTQVAGFNQAFRSIAPESSVAGDTHGADFQTYDLAIEQKFDTGTYLSLKGEILTSGDNLRAGAYNLYAETYFDTGAIYHGGFNETSDYREESLTFTADQLLGKQWTAGTRYVLSQAKFNVSYPDAAAMTSELRTVLQQINLHANWNHPSGLFSSLEANWYHQDNSGYYRPDSSSYAPSEPGQDFWQFNAFAGYRMLQRRVEFTVGLLNLFDQSYSLEPLNLYNQMPQTRTFLARLRISF